MLNNSALILKVLEEVQTQLCGKVTELHIYDDNFGYFTIENNKQSVKVSLNFGEVEKDA